MSDNAKPLVLLTRPQEQADRFAAALREETGGTADILIAPLQRIDLLDLPPLPKAAALVFTSENGVRAYVAGNGPVDRLAYCVGDRTAEAARDAGLEALSAHGTAEDLTALIRSHAPSGPLVHLHGRHVRGQLTATLQGEGIAITGQAVYEQHPLPLATSARAALLSGQSIVVPLFSPRSAHLFAEALPDGAMCHPVCISDASRDALPPALSDRATVAKTPTGAAMLKAVARQLGP